MRRFLAIARVSLVETLAEPLTAVLFLSAFVTVCLVPALHCHQFGEAGRLARECGFSALLVFGLFVTTSAAVRTLARSFEEGTAAATLALDVPRGLFLAAKVAGVAGVFLLFATGICFADALSVSSAEIASHARGDHGASAKVWGGGLAPGLLLTLGAFAAAALANRFLRMRFCMTASILMVLAQPVAFGVAFAWSRSVELPPSFVGFWRELALLAPAFLALAAYGLVFIAYGGALATRLTPPMAATGVAAGVFASFLHPLTALWPDIRGFWFVDGLANGGAVDGAAVLSGLAVAGCLTAFWLLLGTFSLESREVS